MKVEEIRALATEEINVRIEDRREELMNLRFQQATGELVDYNRLRTTRRDIAKMYTVLNERKSEEMEEGVA